MIDHSSKQKASLIGLAKIRTSEGEQSLLALDSQGVVNQWFINDHLFNDLADEEGGGMRQIGERCERKVCYPHKAYRIEELPLDTQVTSIKELNGFVYITGENETIGVNAEKFTVHTIDPHQRANRISIKTINRDLTLKDSPSTLNRRIINGIDCNNTSGHMITYSNKGSLFLFDIQRQSLINTNNTEITSQGYNSKEAILTAKLLDNSQIVYGGNRGRITFLSSKDMNRIGAYDIHSNKYLSLDETALQSMLSIQKQACYDITCLEVTPNYIQASCNNFLLKYNLSLRLCTHIIPTNHTINSFIRTDSALYVASDTKHLFKYPNDKHKPISIETSSASLSSIELIQLPHASSPLLFTGGDSNAIDMISNEVISSLIF